jgi:hypothetical protein
MAGAGAGTTTGAMAGTTAGAGARALPARGAAPILGAISGRCPDTPLQV